MSGRPRERTAIPSARTIREEDAALERHFRHFIEGADRHYGPAAARDLARILERAKREYGLGFGGYVAHLIQADAAAHGWE